MCSTRLTTYPYVCMCLCRNNIKYYFHFILRYYKEHYKANIMYIGMYPTPSATDPLHCSYHASPGPIAYVYSYSTSVASVSMLCGVQLIAQSLPKNL